MQNILAELLLHKRLQFHLGVDIQAAFVMTTNPTYSRRARRIELRLHYAREQIEKEAILLKKVRGDENPADAFTKALGKKLIQRLLELFGVNDAEHD